MAQNPFFFFFLTVSSFCFKRGNYVLSNNDETHTVAFRRTCTTVPDSALITLHCFLSSPESISSSKARWLLIRGPDSFAYHAYLFFSDSPSIPEGFLLPSINTVCAHRPKGAPKHGLKHEELCIHLQICSKSLLGSLIGGAPPPHQSLFPLFFFHSPTAGM